jgi:Domain of unknown function (DUF4349)
MDRFDDDTLFAELRALRPAPRPEFAAELDERAAAGFPRGTGTSAAAAMPFALLADRWRALSPRRRLIPVLGMALAVLVVATAVVAVSQSGTKSNPADDAMLGMAESSGSEAGGAAMGEQVITPAPSHQKSGAQHGPSHPQNGAGGNAGNRSANPNETVYETEVPSVTSEPSSGAEAGGRAAAGGEEAAEESEVETEESASAGTVVRPFDKAASPVTGRKIERSAYVTLGTKPGEVAGAAARVYEAVHAANGVVLHSKVQSGSSGATGAYFELLIPSAKLDDALSAFSQIAEVRERHDATNDITAPTVGAAEELRDSNASIEGLLKELGDTETEAERESVEARLREERGRHASIRARLDHLDKRASMSEVTVRIVTDHGAGVTPPSKDGGSWGVGDALHDAGHILTIAAGVALIGLAILGPIALIALAFWLANRFRVRRLRERTLG